MRLHPVGRRRAYAGILPERSGRPQDLEDIRALDQTKIKALMTEWLLDNGGD